MCIVFIGTWKSFKCFSDMMVIPLKCPNIFEPFMVEILWLAIDASFTWRGWCFWVFIVADIWETHLLENYIQFRFFFFFMFWYLRQWIYRCSGDRRSVTVFGRGFVFYSHVWIVYLFLNWVFIPTYCFYTMCVKFTVWFLIIINVNDIE